MGIRISDQTMAVAGASVVAASVAAGLIVLYVPIAPPPNPGQWRLDYHESLAGFADLARLARCSWLVTGDVAPSSDEAITAIGSNRTKAEESRCDWYDTFPEFRDDTIAWTRKGPTSLELCGHIRFSQAGAHKMPRAHHFTFTEIGNAPVEAGHHCYLIDISTSLPDPDEDLQRRRMLRRLLGPTPSP